MPEIRGALVLAAASDPDAAPLLAALRTHGFAPTTVDQLGRAVLALQADGGISLLVVCGAISGLPAAAVVRALRHLPGRGALPVLAVGEAPAPMPARCTALARPLDAAAMRLALASPPDAWPAAMAAAPADLLDLDPEPLRRAERESPGMARMVADIFHGELQQARPSLPALLAAGDLAVLAKAAHKLKGSSGSLGARELSTRLGELEQAARAGDAARCQAATAALLPLIDRFAAADIADIALHRPPA